MAEVSGVCDCVCVGAGVLLAEDAREQLKLMLRPFFPLCGSLLIKTTIFWSS